MAACSTAAAIKFTVRRQPAVLVAPASPTPRELKRLSDFVDQDDLRLQIPVIHFYERKKSMAMGGKDDKDPAVVIRDAVARALVPYYPFAGRLREHDGGKLAVDCTAEGVLFVEADADVRLEKFGDSLLPPFPCVDELIFNEPMLMIVAVDARGRTGIPTGYYGNAFALPAAVSTAGELCANPVSYAVGLVRQAKAKVDMEYMRSEADLIVRRRGRVPRVPAGLYSLADTTKARFRDLDFGWGKPVYGGPAEAVGTPALPWMSSFILPFKNANGEDGAVVPVCLPRPAMDRLVVEMGKLRRSPAEDVATLQQSRCHGFPAVVTRSAL